MADKRAVKRGLKRLESVRTWQLFIILIFAGLLAATFLRLNNVGMVERREAVKVADEQGDPQVLQERLYELQRYSMSKMNASSGAFSLTHQFSRDYEAAIQKTVVGDSLEINRKIEQECKAQTNSTYGQAWIQCFEDRLGAMGPGKDPVKDVQFPNPDEYRIEYMSPVWSADFAGFTVLLCLIIAVLIIARITGVVILRIILRARYRSV